MHINLFSTIVLSILQLTIGLIENKPFFIGTSTSAYQIEGHQPGLCIWDSFTKNRNLEPVGNATNHYLLYKEDIKLIHDLGFRDYRMSISWTRIMPNRMGEINMEGIQFYNNIFDELERYNITPYVTIYHWELPEYVQQEIGGWSDPRIIEYYTNYSKILFDEYAHRIRYWITINEPLTTSIQGYGTGTFAPGIKSEREQFLSAHYQLLAHAHVANYYRLTYGDYGSIGIAINSNWYEPIDINNQLSVIIAKREVMKNLGWFTDPLFFGKYPNELNGLVPEFTLSEKILLRNSIDFFGLNHYTSYLINNKGEITVDPNWVQATSTWLYDVPFGIYNILAFIKDRYGDIPIYITESGFSMKNDTINDIDRINYLNNYILETLKCIDEKKVNVKGFFVWSLLDNFEWSSGYNETFGIIYVNRTDYSRIPKNSALLLRDYIN